jgi:uncharacterized protein involved in exopolysaccharide biosynthesis
MSDVLIPIDGVKRAMQFWWLVVLLALVGGGVGWLASRIQPRVYETYALISLNIDFTRAGDLTDVQQDHAIVTAGDIIESTDVIKEVASSGIPFAADQLTLDRVGYRYALRVRASDPNQAAQIANLWAETALKALTEASTHAIRADHIQRLLDAQESCLSSGVDTATGQTPCQVASVDDLNKLLQASGAELKQELALSHGMLSYMRVDLSHLAETPTVPTLYRVNLMILGGGLVGLLAGILLAQVRLPGEHQQKAGRG